MLTLTVLFSLTVWGTTSTDFSEDMPINHQSFWCFKDDGAVWYLQTDIYGHSMLHEMENGKYHYGTYTYDGADQLSFDIPGFDFHESASRMEYGPDYIYNFSIKDLECYGIQN